MTDKDQYIRDRTNKGTADLTKRFLSCSVDDKKTLAWLMGHLQTKGLLSVDEFETMLFEARLPGW